MRLQVSSTVNASTVVAILVGCSPLSETTAPDADHGGGGSDSAGDSADTAPDSGDIGDSSADTGLPDCDRTRGWIDVTAGRLLTCGVHTDGCAECWGAPTFDPATHDTGGDWGTSGYLKRVPDGPWTHIELSRDGWELINSIACGLRPNGDLDCWGFWESATWPGPWTSPTIHADYVPCAVDAEGVATCRESTWPELAPPTAAVQLQALNDGFLAVLTTGEVWYDMSQAMAPEPIGMFGSPESIYVQAASDGDVVCAVDDAGTLSCGEVLWTGRAWITQPPEGDFLDVCLVSGWSENFDMACARRTDGTAVCWGHNAYEAPADEQFDVLSCGETQVCGVTTDQRIVCWGDCAFGECDPPT